MAIKFKVKIKNVNQLLNVVPHRQEIPEKMTADILKYHAGLLVNKSKKYCPVDTGALQTSIRDTTKQDGGNDFCRYVSANTNYASYVEYGTSRTRPQPYMIPASYEIEEELYKSVKKAIVKMFR